MSRTFTRWLMNEAASAKCALLTAYEQRDKLQYIDAPLLERQYLSLFGEREQEVIKAEIECELLHKKKQLVQAAINRRAPIDEAAIDAELANEREEMIKKATGEEPPQMFDLNAEQSDELQEIYREIVRDFHPQTHPELTEVHKQLFQKAQEAYRIRDIDALKLIHEMLKSTQEEAGLEVMCEVMMEMGTDEDEASLVDTTDYSLAAQLYEYFSATAEDAVLREECDTYKKTLEVTMLEMKEMKENFPFTAAEMLADPAQIEEYKTVLEHRMRVATEDRERMTKEIRAMIDERVAVSG